MTGANRAVITGNLASGPSSGQAVVFELAFAGSLGGLNAVTGNLSTIPNSGFASSQTWLSPTANTLTALSGTGAIAGATILSSPNFDTAGTPDATMSDSFQSSTPYGTPALVEENPAGNGIGVVDFNWVKGTQHASIPSASYNAFTNITTLQAQDILANGFLPLSLFTGNSADAGYDVLLVGRNNDSGTRLDAEAETGYGFGGVEAQFQPNTSSGNITGTTFVGDNGFSSGGSVAASLNRPVSGADDANGVPYVFVGYLGKSDTATATSGSTPGVALTYNGEGNSNTNIQNGAYTFWSYEHLYYRSGFSGVKKNAIDLISNQARVTDGIQSGTLLSTMNVSRSIEGGLVN
jgi:hypothetical protein